MLNKRTVIINRDDCLVKSKSGREWYRNTELSEDYKKLLNPNSERRKPGLKILPKNKKMDMLSVYSS